jgi:hypothetical protein
MNLQAASIAQHAKARRLAAVGAQFASLAEEAAQRSHSHLHYLEALLQAEVEVGRGRLGLLLLIPSRFGSLLGDFAAPSRASGSIRPSLPRTSPPCVAMSWSRSVLRTQHVADLRGAVNE